MRSSTGAQCFKFCGKGGVSRVFHHGEVVFLTIGSGARSRSFLVRVRFVATSGLDSRGSVEMSHVGRDMVADSGKISVGA